MKSFRKELVFNVPNRVEFINITNDVQEAINESGIQDGLVLVNAMHITASVFINDNESGLHNDYKDGLKNLLRMNLFRFTSITGQVKTMAMLI